jgi:hypothetical protein
MRHAARVFLVLFSLGATTAIAQTADEADNAYRAQQWEKAAAAYQKITAAESQNGLAWFRLGSAQVHLGHYADAAAAFERAESLKFAPLYTPYNLAAAYARMGNKEKALAALGVAADRGFQQPDQLEKSDDFASLRADAGFQQVLARVRSNAEPCRESPESRQFDFWIGEWNVQTAQGQPAGESSIQLILGTCVIFENWTGRTGYTGKSFNLYNVPRKKWQQYWVDSSGAVTTFEGGLEGNQMRVAGPTFPRSGEGGLRRMTFTPLAPDKVRQFGETSSDGGQTWKPEYDLIYVRKTAAAAGK